MVEIDIENFKPGLLSYLWQSYITGMYVNVSFQIK